VRRAVLIIVLLLTTATACATQSAHAGQSGPPFYLWVTFRPNTSVPTAAKVLSECRHQPDVIRTGQVVKFHGTLRGTVYTKSLGRSGETKQLLSCLQAAKSVQAAAWPD
jgi:hypothetical protein